MDQHTPRVDYPPPGDDRVCHAVQETNQDLGRAKMNDRHGDKIDIIDYENSEVILETGEIVTFDSIPWYWHTQEEKEEIMRTTK